MKNIYRGNHGIGDCSTFHPTLNNPDIENLLNCLLYEAQSYWLDEGDYQPTEEEMRNKIREYIKSFIQSLLTRQREMILKEIEDGLPKESPNEPQLCQNRNLIDYCGTCEQGWENCSCPARNTGFNMCLKKIHSLLTKLKKGE